MSFEEFVILVQSKVSELIEEEPQRHPIGPSFVWDKRIATWRVGITWATVSESPETGPHFGSLLVLGRDPSISSPLGAQATTIPFAFGEDSINVIAAQIAGHLP